ncbi:MAG: hypothetical protein J2P21_10165 [Chloracidobacterium sp.]|nr:hypothetical protein [Chloracidobacterium sp.]
MFCPSCGFEYTQKINYCKRCGESLSLIASADAPKTPRSRIVGMFWAIAAFCVLGLVTVFNAYDHLVYRGLRGDELMMPFVMGLFFTSAVAGLLIWMLARMISVHQKTGRNVIVEKHFIHGAPPANLSAPTGEIQQVVEPPSVIEHTTRQLADLRNEPVARS